MSKATQAEASDAKGDDVGTSPFFKIIVTAPLLEGARGNAAARVGELLGLPTPRCTLLTSRGMPLQLRPELYTEQLEGERQLMQLPIGDLLLRCEAVEKCPDAKAGCVGFWPHLNGHVTYNSFRNPRMEMSVHGGDAVLQVESFSGRRKISPTDVLEIQQIMRNDIVAALGEEVPLNVTSSRRSSRAVARASDWLKELLEKKRQTNFDWYVLASIQGGSSGELRRKACETSMALPGVSGYWIGGLGYDESLTERASVLLETLSVLPDDSPRFLPLNAGSPIEVLQAVLLGVDVLETDHPVRMAEQGLAYTFSLDMPDDWQGDSHDNQKALSTIFAAAHSEADGGTASSDTSLPAGSATPTKVVRQIQLHAADCRENFGPISEESPVLQYSRAYFYHLLQLRELLGTQLLTRHNIYMYEKLFSAIRDHIKNRRLPHFAAWFLQTQLGDPPEVAMPEKTAKKRRR